ncbi:PEP-CTERM sorting domain-containing protein [Roseateles chitinivorans]|uniref:PEP-CTERM sorting domain-containing protein n=1 Tax=Roseateles chitinivorans TaxID=2917965 RepID=UPI003D66BFBC
MTLLTRLLASVALSVASLASQASTVTFNTIDNGWYRSDGLHDASVSNTITGLYAGFEYRSFYAFTLPELAAGQTIVSATITFFANGGNIGWIPEKHLGLFDYKGSIDALLAATGGTAAFGDLGSGASYGTAVIPGVYNDGTRATSVQLTGAALNDLLNASGNRFVVGASLLDSFVGKVEEAIWAGSSLQPAASLTLVTTQAVPEPDSIALLGAAALAFGIVARRRKAR